MDDYISSGGASSAADGQNFTLTFGTATTSTITYSSSPTTMALNIQNALQALSNIGAGGVTVASTIALNNYTPPGPITGYNGFSVIFGGSLAHLPESTMTISDANDNVATWQVGTSSSLASTVTSAYTLTAYAPIALAVASTTGFTAGNPVAVGNITALITSVNTGAGTLTVTPETSGSVLAGTTVKQLGASGFVDGGGQLGNGQHFCSPAIPPGAHPASSPLPPPKTSPPDSPSPSPPPPTPNPSPPSPGSTAPTAAPAGQPRPAERSRRRAEPSPPRAVTTTPPPTPSPPTRIRTKTASSTAPSSPMAPAPLPAPALPSASSRRSLPTRSSSQPTNPRRKATKPSSPSIPAARRRRPCSGRSAPPAAQPGRR